MAEMTDEKFFAWLDGELRGDEAEEVARRVAADPELAALAQQHRALGTRLSAAFKPVAEAPVPQRIADAIERPNVVSFARARDERAATRAPLMWYRGAAVAAALALAVTVGNVFVGGVPSPVEAEAGRLVASADLEEALYTRLASAPASEGPRIGLTFRDGGGNVCRTFTDRAASGLACHEGGDWRIRGLVQPPEGQQGEYRMAAGTDPNLAAMVESAMAGEPFDAEQEKAVRERGWR